MNRRNLLLATGVTLTTGLAGCFEDGEASIESISASEPTIEQGETAEIQIESPNLTRLHISHSPDAFPDDHLTIGEATFTPEPDVTFQSLPPHWEFSGDDVTGTIPIQTSEDTPPGSYHFALSFQLQGEEYAHSKDVTVTVEPQPSD